MVWRCKIVPHKSLSIHKLGEETSKPVKTSDNLPSGSNQASPEDYTDTIPKGIHLKFEAHDGEVNAVCWTPAKYLFATGGADRKVKMWDVRLSTMKPCVTFVGSNATINSIEFDLKGSLLLTSCNDSTSRLWTVADKKLRHTLSGHSKKVMAAKFLGDASKVITGSHDRTLKIWNLQSKACVKTFVTASSCNDLVTVYNDIFISGHHDQKIRFWDNRLKGPTNEVVVSGRVTSLDASKDGQYLLSCTRDDTIQMLDLRTHQIIRTFSNEHFKVPCDWSRCAFNRDDDFIAAGGHDGEIFIWNINGKLETILKGSSAAAVTAVSWDPFSDSLATVDRAKSCTIWGNAC
ncbi:autophagy-related protein 16-1-like [Sitodiplosis mosellana]|uniref:autophagy-related protein 16-1-like n=1 Tax=Sitodiplosis mosellana TaxID=263140 RepID=UPI0024439352|nr:autophagy-related protein 16-1-like [Sitodiplosis mosellana]